MTITSRKTLSALLAAVCIGSTAALAAPAGAAPSCPRTVPSSASKVATARALRDSCSQAAFDRLFAGAARGTMPLGVMNGQTRPVGAPDDALSSAAAAIWSGKTFHRGWLTNRTAAGDLVPADVYVARSTVDNRPVIRIDYRRSGLPFAHDELRRLPNGVYLGYGFLGNARQVDFWVWR
ncbi:MAG: hypothetical protein QM774_11860 [Gordonia sp. (in: high G+C Gram-positive bacteria)]|uniref:hypothetical protein n=1 Tax=Gordonia sp. (in: high G+C Gram-positive bacteria) TaxID=84139 RepID=UPI0039E58EFB